MSVYVECICGKKYEIDRTQVEHFDCAGCGRELHVPDEALEQKLTAIRQRMTQGEPGMRDAMQQAAELRNFHAVPLLKQGAESGMRESVNAALVGLVDFPGPGRDVLKEWIKGGNLSVSRLVNSLREQKYEPGADYLCELFEQGHLKENQIAEVSPYLGDSNSIRALEALREARRKFPNLSGPLDQAMSRMRHLSATAGKIPDSAKRIPGREAADREAADAEVAEKKGCMGLLLVLALLIGMLATAAYLI